MMDRLEDFEKRKQQSAEEFDDALHRNFRPGDKVSENETQLSDKELALSKKEMQRQARYGDKWQGDIGEGLTIRAASEKLGLTPDPRFDQPYQGFDGVYRDPQSHEMVLVESKFTKIGLGSLGDNQMQPEDVRRIAKLMQNPNSEQYTPGNAEIGAEIERVGPENIRRLVITTNPSTLEVQTYEAQADGSWKQIAGWSAFEFDQPH